MTDLRLAAQEHKVPGNTLTDKFRLLTKLGYDGLVLRSKGNFEFAARLSELQAAHKAGVIMPTAVMDMNRFIGDFDPEHRREAIENIKSQLSVMAQIEGYGVVIPASYGILSTNLPPYTSPRSADEDRTILLEGLHELGEHAKKEGTTLLLEPLNRYEDFMVNNLAQAVDLLKAVGLRSIRITADLYHLSIEEDDIPAAIKKAGDWIGWVDISENNRYQPGCGHQDWVGILRALQDIGYENYLTLEGRLRGDAIEALRQTAEFMRGHMAHST